MSLLQFTVTLSNMYEKTVIVKFSTTREKKVKERRRHMDRKTNGLSFSKMLRTGG